MLKLDVYQHIYCSARPQNEAWNSSKSFSVTSLRFPRGTVGVLGPSYSTKVEIEDGTGTDTGSGWFINIDEYYARRI
jgi:hypothetical protein